jgi:hypothetical protein
MRENEALVALVLSGLVGVAVVSGVRYLIETANNAALFESRHLAHALGHAECEQLLREDLVLKCVHYKETRCDQKDKADS